MAKNDDKIEYLEEKDKQRDIEEGIRKGLTKWAHTICMTATSAIMGAFYGIGGFMYQHFDSLKVAIKAYIDAERGGQ